MASTAKAYPNPPASNSEKFSLIELVRASNLPERYRSRLAELMVQFNFTGEELWMATESCQIAIGQICVRRKAGTIMRVREGREEKCTLGPCTVASRRTVQRMLYDLVNVFGVLEVSYEANRWVPYGGEVVFRHSRTYRLRADRLKRRETFREFRSRQRVTPIRKPSQPAPPDPGAPAAPLPPRQQPAAEHAHHRGTQKPPQPKLTKRECAKFAGDLIATMKGVTRSNYNRDALVEGICELDPGDPRYRPKMNWREALQATCAQWKRSEESVIEALKFWGYRIESEDKS